MKKFENIKVGDQLEMPASRNYGTRKDTTRDPDRPVKVAIVTHRWHDPVERKDYVGLAKLYICGPEEHPSEKRTIRGLAQNGWRYATKDWLAQAKAMAAPNVMPMRRTPKPLPPCRIYKS